MGDLPTARPRTYVNGMPAVPDDFNNIFDAIINLNNGIHPAQTRPLGIFSGGLANMAWNETAYISASAANGRLRMDLPIAVGERVTRFSYSLLKGDANNATVSIQKFVNGIGTTIGSDVTSGVGTVGGEINIGTPVAVAAGEQWVMDIVLPTINDRVYAAWVDVDRVS